jgi:15-cis-phytoene synthase
MGRAGPIPLSASYLVCHRLTRRTARNFYPAFLLLPRRKRRGMEALYAFMRLTDDLGDDAGLLDLKRQHLKFWRDDLLKEIPNSPIHPALFDTLRRFEIPKAHLVDVIRGVESDLVFRQPRTFAQLEDYCYRVASVVGLACIRIWGVDDVPEAQQAAVDLGIAFQLTNILRDLAEDKAAGRVYLPEEELAKFECPPDRWTPGDPSFRGMMAFQIARAFDYYRRGSKLAAYLSPEGRAIHRAMTATYRGLLEAIAERPEAVLSQRVRLSKSHKLGNLLGAIPTRFGWRGWSDQLRSHSSSVDPKS